MTYWNLMIPMLAHSQLLLYCGTHGGKRADKTHKTPTRCLARPKSKYTSRHSPAKCSAIGTCPVVQALSWRANCCAVRNKQGEITKLSVHRLWCWKLLQQWLCIYYIYIYIRITWYYDFVSLGVPRILLGLGHGLWAKSGFAERGRFSASSDRHWYEVFKFRRLNTWW